MIGETVYCIRMPHVRHTLLKKLTTSLPSSTPFIRLALSTSSRHNANLPWATRLATLDPMYKDLSVKFLWDYELHFCEMQLLKNLISPATDG